MKDTPVPLVCQVSINITILLLIKTEAVGFEPTVLLVRAISNRLP